jgi:hypothetical protein
MADLCCVVALMMEFVRLAWKGRGSVVYQPLYEAMIVCCQRTDSGLQKLTVGPAEWLLVVVIRVHS